MENEENAEEAVQPKLNDRQKRFVIEYVASLNATHAAKKAGYSEKTAYSIGQENLKKPEIRAAVDKLLDEKIMPANEILDRLGQQARGEHADYWRCDFGEKPYIDMVALISDGKAHLIKSVTRDAESGRVTKVEFYDGQAALVHLGRHRKLWTDKTEVEGTIGVGVVRVPAKSGDKDEWTKRYGNVGSATDAGSADSVSD